MSNARFHINPNALAKVTQATGEKWAAGMTAALNALLPQWTGKPITDVKWAVSSTWVAKSGNGASITDPELTTLAESIAAGQAVRISAKSK